MSWHTSRQCFRASSENPPTQEKVKAEIVKQLEYCYQKTLKPLHDTARDVLTELIVPQWVGMPEGFDPKKLISELDTISLQTLVDVYRLPQDSFPGSLILLELMKRRGDIEDWSFTRHDATTADTGITLKKPVSFIRLNFIVGEEKKSDDQLE